MNREELDKECLELLNEIEQIIGELDNTKGSTYKGVERRSSK